MLASEVLSCIRPFAFLSLYEMTFSLRVLINLSESFFPSFDKNLKEPEPRDLHLILDKNSISRTKIKLIGVTSCCLSSYSSATLHLYVVY